MRNLRDNSGLADEMRAAHEDTVRRFSGANPEQVFFHFDIRRSLQMHRKLATGILLGAVVLSMAYTARRWKTYKSESLVYVQPSPHRVIESGPEQQWPYDANTYESYIQQQVHDVTRPDVLAAAVKRLPGWQGASESEQAAADRLGSNIEVTRVGTAYEVSIVATAGSAAEAAQMANAVAGSFIDSATRQERAGDPQRIELLRDERDRIVKELAVDRAEQQDLSRKLGVAAVGGNTPDPIDEQIAQTRAELVKAKTDDDQAAAKLTALAGGATSNAALDAEADALVSADPGLVSMKTSLNARRSQLISQMANLTPNHPAYKQDADELAKINASLEEMTRELRAKAAAQIEQRLKTDRERTSSVYERLNGQLAQLTGAAGTAAPRMQRTNELAADIQRLQNRFSVVDEQFRNLTMEDNAPGAVYLASAALPPLHAARAKVLRNAFILLMGGLVFALGGALVAHNFDPRVYIATDVERALGFPPMAQLPDIHEVGPGVAEEYMLRLAAAVEHAHQEGLLNSCIFTGVAAGAGVTTVSGRVSSMLEAMGRETVLVDAVGAPPPPNGETSAGPGTDIVHAPRGSRSTALLQQMAEETNRDTVVVTDAAPLLVSGETEYMARFVDSAIVVIESGVTTKAQLREVSKTLQRLEVSSVGFVLNRISLKNANPAFRSSVHAVEMHLRTQSRAREHFAPKPETTPRPQAPVTLPPAGPEVFDRLLNMVSETKSPAVPARSAQPAEARPDPAPPQPEPAKAAETAPPPVTLEPMILAPEVKRPEPPPAVRMEEGLRPSKAVEPERAPVQEFPSKAPEPVASAGVAAPRPAAPVAAPPIAPAAVPAAVPAAAVPPAAPAQSQRAEVRVPTPASVAQPMRGREPVRPAPAGDTRPRSGQPVPVPAPASVSQQSQPAPAAPVRPEDAESTRRLEELAAEIARRHPTAQTDRRPQQAEVPPTVQRPEPRTTPNPEPTVRAALEEMPANPAPEPALLPRRADTASDDLPYSAASRLGGLRNLMTSLGIKNLHKDDHRKAGFDPEPATERVVAQVDTPVGLMDGRVATPPHEVKAAPEIIPPRLNTAEIADAERECEKEIARPGKTARVKPWEMIDEVETLPARRGQYRKRR